MIIGTRHAAGRAHDEGPHGMVQHTPQQDMRRRTARSTRSRGSPLARRAACALSGRRPFATLLAGLLLGAAPRAQTPSATAPLSPPAALTPQQVGEREALYWVVEPLQPPDGALLEVGGMDWMPDGRLVLSTRRGQVWMVTRPLAPDLSEARFQLYAEGLQEGLGLNVMDVPDGKGGSRSALYVLQRGELTELRDEDGDGRAETWVRVCDDWGLSGNYHEFAFGLPDDGQGSLYLSLNVGFLDPEWWLGRSVVPWRGWVLRVDPVTGRSDPLACGFRSPCGLGFDQHGRLLLSDNQGDWLPSTPVYVVQPGHFYGHPASLDWTEPYRRNGLHASLEQPPEQPRTPAAVWLPYAWSRSAGNLVPLPADGSFGPYTDQLVMAELTNGHLMRVQLETVQGVVQGAALPLRQRIGSVVRLLFAKDGTLFAGLTNRGWGGLSPDSGVLRLRTAGAPPLEIDRVHLVPGGFELSFSAPLSEQLGVDPPAVMVTQYDYDYWWEYGSPERHRVEREVERVMLAPDRRGLSLAIPELRPAMVARVRLTGVVAADGRPLLHDEFAYTVNQLADGPFCDELVAKAVPPPPPKLTAREGVLRLSYGDALDAWVSSGWQLVDAGLDPTDPSTFVISPGVNALVNVGTGEPSDYVSRYAFGAGRTHVEFMLARGSHSVVWIQGRYGIALCDDSAELPDGVWPTGTLPAAVDGSAAARPPATQTHVEPGEWHSLDVDFEAPASGPDGQPASPAILRQVSLDGVILHTDVELSTPSRGAPWADSPPAPTAPLVIGGQGGPLALRTLEFIARPAEQDEQGWVNLISGDDLSGWRFVPSQAAGDEATEQDPGWVLEDGELIGEGPASWLLSPRDDYTDLSVRAEVRINAGGDGGLLLCARAAGSGVTGYEAQINSSYSDPCKTGGLYGLAPVKVELVNAGTWFKLAVDVHDEARGTRITIAVNGVTTVDYVDPERRHASGAIALQQHHDGGVIRFRELRVKTD